MDPRIFTPFSQELSSYSIDELQQAIDERRDLVRRVIAEDSELLPADRFTADDVLFELAAANDQIEKLSAELEAREQAVAAYESERNKLAARAGVTMSAAEPETDEDGDGEEGDAPEAPAEEPAPVEEPAEPVEDAGTTAAAALRRPPLPKPTAQQEPAIADEPRARGLVAAAEFVGAGIKAGDDLDRRSLAELMISAARRVTPQPGQRVDVVVASAGWEAPEERQLRSDDPEGNADKIRAVVSPQALAASGGLCAPLTPIYTLPQISVDDRPLRDSLPAFQADRGGITWPVPPSIANVSGAVGVVTAEADGEGGTFATKTCQILECGEFDSAEVAAIYHCLEWGNIGARAWPERVSQFTEVVMAAWSRLAETNLLNQLKAGSTQVTAAAATYGYGALSNFTSQILVAAAGYRSRFRMAADSRFRVVAPAWVRDLVLSDLINSQFDRFAIQGYAGVDAFLQQRNIDPVWHLDDQNSGGQIFGSQNAGALLTFPDSVKWFLYPEGTWMWVTMGTLELGIVRDSTLNATNDFQVFGEGFETIAQVGYQSLEITSALCPSGATGGPATLITCA